jgi:hypothetical protein
MYNRTYRTKKGEYLKDTINEFETDSKDKLWYMFRGINEFEKGYRPGTNLVKGENMICLQLTVFGTGPRITFASYWMYVHGVNYTRPSETLTADQLVPELTFSVEIVI